MVDLFLPSLHSPHLVLGDEKPPVGGGPRTYLVRAMDTACDRYGPGTNPGGMREGFSIETGEMPAMQACAPGGSWVLYEYRGG